MIFFDSSLTALMLKNSLISNLSKEEHSLFGEIESANEKLKIPNLKIEVIALILQILRDRPAKNILEFGSGVGTSAFWLLSGPNLALINKIYLTERRPDCAEEFHKICWPLSWKEKIVFWEGDALFNVQKNKNQMNSIDFLLIDGQKNQYLSFLRELIPLLSSNARILVDNVFLCSSKTASVNSALQELSDFIYQSNHFFVTSLSINDGVFLLQKK